MQERLCLKTGLNPKANAVTKQRYHSLTSLLICRERREASYTIMCERFLQEFYFSVSKLCPTLCDPMDCSTPGFSVLHHLMEFAQTHVH